MIVSRLFSWQTVRPNGGSSCGNEHVWNLLLIFITATSMLSMAWVGYVGSDDQSYARGALGWLNSFPYIGENHWQLRHPLVIPLAASLAIFGHREISLGIPSATFFFIFLGVNYYYLQRFFDVRYGVLASLLLATTPLFVVYATFAQTVVIETLLLSTSFWLFCSAVHREKRARLMFASGVFLGFGFFLRETAGVLVLFYSILFGIGFGVRRRYYWIMALGFLLIVGMEMAYLGAFTGDPFYRYRIDIVHDGPRTSNWHPGTGDVLATSGNLERGGAIFYPILSLLVNQEFGLVFWLFIPAVIWVFSTRGLAPEKRRLLQLLTGLGLLWMVFISYGRVLAVIPRFYTISLWAAIVVIAYWVRHCFHDHHQRKVAIIVGASMVGANLFCIYVDNKDPVFAERALVAYTMQHDGAIVYTDPTTLRFASLLLEFKGVAGRARSDPAPPGALYFFNKKNIDYCRRYGCYFSWKDYVPKSDWRVLMRMEPKRKFIGTLLAVVGLDKLLPKAIFERLDRPNSGGILYLTSANP
jgi:Dolichyl-phosphate-mannose-protein mannosyltransferase